MKPTIAIASLLLLTTCLVAPETKSQTTFSFSPTIQRINGSTDYTMEVVEVLRFPNLPPLTWKLRSELKFPLDINMAGINGSMITRIGQLPRMEFDFGILSNLGDPSSQMEDSDWESLTYFYNEKFSFTKSDASIKAVIIDLSLALELYRESSFTIDLLVGYRHFHLRQDIIGYDGWWRPLDLNTMTFLDAIPQSGDERAIFYKVTYKLPKIGLRLRTDEAQKLSVRTDLLFTRALFSDFDDHVLRGKTATSDGSGTGFIADALVSYIPGSMLLGKNVVVSLVLGFMQLDANGDQMQKWYKDEGYIDPDTGEWVGVRAGDIFTDIPHEVNTTAVNFGLSIGLTF